MFRNIPWLAPWRVVCSSAPLRPAPAMPPEPRRRGWYHGAATGLGCTGGRWMLATGHWPSTRHIWIVLGNRGTPGTGRTVRFLLHYNIRLFDFIMNGCSSELAQSIAVHAFSLPGITVVVWPPLPLGVVQRLEHAVLARSHGRLVRIVSDCPGPVVILGNIVTRIPLPFSFAKSINIKLFIRF